MRTMISCGAGFDPVGSSHWASGSRRCRAPGRISSNRACFLQVLQHLARDDLFLDLGEPVALLELLDHLLRFDLVTLRQQRTRRTTSSRSALIPSLAAMRPSTKEALTRSLALLLATAKICSLF